MDQLRPWQRFDDRSEPGQLCALAAERLRRDPIVPTHPATIPFDFGRTPGGVSPDVSSTTNLAGWVNKVEVWSSAERHNWFADDTETILHRREKPTGQRTWNWASPKPTSSA